MDYWELFYFPCWWRFDSVYRIWTIENYSTSLVGGDLIRFIGYGLFGLFALPALGRDELGSRFGPASGVGQFYWTCL